MTDELVKPGDETETYASDETIPPAQSVESDWIDNGKRRDELLFTRTATGGTYLLEVDYSADGGATTLSTDTVDVADGDSVAVTPAARWYRIRISNDHVSEDIDPHTTSVSRDGRTGVVG